MLFKKRPKYTYEVSEKGINLIRNLVDYCHHRITKHESGIGFISVKTIKKLRKEIRDLWNKQK